MAYIDIQPVKDHIQVTVIATPGRPDQFGGLMATHCKVR